MKTTKRTWTIKIETMYGEIKNVKYRGRTYSEAIDEMVSDIQVGNILEVRDSKRVRWM